MARMRYKLSAMKKIFERAEKKRGLHFESSEKMGKTPPRRGACGAGAALSALAISPIFRGGFRAREGLRDKLFGAAH